MSILARTAATTLIAFTAACARPPVEEPLASVPAAPCEPGVHHEKAVIKRDGGMLTITAPKHSLVPDGEGGKVCARTTDMFSCNSAKIPQCTERNLHKLLDPKFAP